MRGRVSHFWLLTATSVLLFLLALPLFARSRFQGYVEQGGLQIRNQGSFPAARSGSAKTNPYVQQSYPSATVTVYLPGTTTLATIYADASGTAKTNPFTASTNGFWFFFGDNSTYDVRFSGAGIDTPYTWPRVPGDSSSSDAIRAVDFGVVCDGTTDDTVALQAAIDSAIAEGGVQQRMTVRLPRGRCLLSPQGANAYAIDVPPGYSGNGGNLGTIIIEGDGGTQLLLSSTDTIGTVLAMTSTADKPVLRINGGRDVIIRNLSIDGTGAVTDSVGASVYNFNSQVTFENVGFSSFADLVRIGDPDLPDGGSSNNDLITFRGCLFTIGTVAIAVYGFNSYGVVVEGNSFFSSNVATGVKYFPDPAGTARANNDIKIRDSQFLVSDNVVWSAGAAVSRLGVTEITGCTIEAAATNNAMVVIHRQDNTAANTFHGLVITNNTINLNGIDNSTITLPAVQYYGRGPFRFSDNYVDSYRWEFQIGTTSSTINQGSLLIGNNTFRSRPIIRYPIGDDYPALTIEPNSWQFLPVRNTTDATIDLTQSGGDGFLRKGIGTYSAVDTNTGSSYRDGSIVLTTNGIRTFTDSGTYGTLTAVTGSITAGTNTLTLNGGATGERAKISNGTFITIAGCAGVYEVDNTVGDTVTLRTNCAAGAATAAVAFQAPTLSAAGIP